MVGRDTSNDDVAYLMQLVRAHDRPRYYATLFAPLDVRDDLFAIYGFAAEIARVLDIVTEPQLGEIRLRWWSEELAAAAPDRAGAPAVRAVAHLIDRHSLPLAPFQALIEARAADLYSDPPATLTDLEGQIGETESAVFQMAAVACGAGSATADAAGHAGLAYGIARRLSAFASDRARGRSILPADILASEGLSASDVFAPSAPSALHRVVGILAAAARHHHEEARKRVATLPAHVQPAFLPLAVVEPLLRRIERLGPALIGYEARLSNLESLLRITSARLFHRRSTSARRA